MARNTNQTVATDARVTAYLDTVDDPARRADCDRLLELMQRVVGEPAVMWGPSIVGFGSYHYRYDSGREGDMCLTGFASRKSSLSIYILNGFDDQPELMKKLGKHRTGKGCLYVKRLDDIDLDVLEALVRNSVQVLRARYPDD